MWIVRLALDITQLFDQSIFTQLEVLDGLAENTKVVMNPTDDLTEGVQVHVKPTEKPKADASAKQSPSGQ